MEPRAYWRYLPTPSGAVASGLAGMPRKPAPPSSAYFSSIGVAAAAVAKRIARAAPRTAVRSRECGCIPCSPNNPPCINQRFSRRRQDRLSARRYDRQQEIGLPVAAGMDRVGAGIVVGMIVRVVHAADAVARLDVEPDAVALPEHHRGRPNLDLDPHDLAGGEKKAAPVAMIGPMG